MDNLKDIPTYIDNDLLVLNAADLGQELKGLVARCLSHTTANGGNNYRKQVYQLCRGVYHRLENDADLGIEAFALPDNDLSVVAYILGDLLVKLSARAKND